MTSSSMLARIRDVLMCNPEETPDTAEVAKLVVATASLGGLGLVIGPALSGKSVALQKALRDTSTSAVTVEPTSFADGRHFGELLCRVSALPPSTARVPIVHGSLIADAMGRNGVRLIIVENADRLVTHGCASANAIHTLTNVALEMRKRHESLGIVVVGRASSTIFAHALAHDLGEPAQRHRMGPHERPLAFILNQVKVFTSLQILKLNALDSAAPVYDPTVVNHTRQMTLATGGRVGMIARLFIMAWQNAASAKQTPVSLHHFAQAWESVSHDPEWCTRAYGNPFEANPIKDDALIEVLRAKLDIAVAPDSPSITPARGGESEHLKARTPPNRRMKAAR